MRCSLPSAMTRAALGWVALYLHCIFLVVKIDKDKRLVVLDEELEVCSRRYIQFYS